MHGDIDWSEFLRRPVPSVEASLADSAVCGEPVLITGAGGSIGSRLAQAVLAGRPRALVLLDISEGALYQSWRNLSSLASEMAGPKIVPVTGSVVDPHFLAHLIRRHRPELIFHAAAYKHVPLMEWNPFSAMANNAFGTYRLVLAALEAGVGRLIAVSTDKAVNPMNVMGVSKRIAELAVLSHAPSQARMNVVRLCNVLGSSGSVAALFREQAEQRVPLTVTDSEAERYFLAPGEASAAILRAAAAAISGRVLMPDFGAPYRIVDLAGYIARDVGLADARVEFIGLRPGDKLGEELLARDETVESELPGGLRIVNSPAPSMQEMALFMERLERAVESFRRDELMDVVAGWFPGFGDPLGLF